MAFGLALNVGLQFLSAAISPKQNIKGPKPEDDRAQISTYGEMISMVHGTMRLGGNIIAMPREMRVQRLEQGGGLFGPTVVTFRRIESYEIALCEAPGDVLAIWANGKLIYDVRDGGGAVKLKKKYRNMTITVRSGAEDQLPAEIWEAEFGIGNMPAGRGVLSVLIEDIPLDDFGNATPQFEFLVSKFTTDAAFPPVIHFQDPTPTPNHLDNEKFLIDIYRGRLWAPSSPNADFFSLYDITKQKYRHTNALSTGTLAGGGIDHWDIDYFTGDLITMGNFMGSLSGPGITPGGPVRINGSTGQITQWAIDPHGVVNPGRGCAVAAHPPLDFINDQRDPEDPEFDLIGAEVVYGMEQDAFGGRSLYCWHLRTFELLWTKPTEHFPGQDPEVMISDGVNLYVWMSNLTLTVSFLTKISPGGVIIWNVNLGDQGWPGVRSVGFWPEGNRGVLCSSTRIATFDPNTGEVGASLTFPGEGVVNERAGIRNRVDLNGIVWVSDNTHGYLVDLKTNPPTLLLGDGAEQFYSAWSGAHSNYQNAGFYDAIGGIVARTDFDQGDDFDLFLLPGKIVDPGNETTLAIVVSDYIQHTSMELNDFDVTALTDIVHGSIVRQLDSVRGMIEPLRQLYFFDGTNVDGKLVFVKRGGAVTRSFPDTSEMAAHALGEEVPAAIERLLAEEVEVPRKFTMRYFDIEKDYDIGSQEFSDPTAQGDAQLQAEYHLAFDKNEARQRAEVLIQEMRIGREQATIRFGPKHIDLVPTDVIEVTD